MPNIKTIWLQRSLVNFEKRDCVILEESPFKNECLLIELYTTIPLHSILTQYSRWHDLWRPPTFLRWQDLITPTTNLMNTLHKFEFKTFLILMKHPEQNCFYIVILNTGNICINTYYIYIIHFYRFYHFILWRPTDVVVFWNIYLLTIALSFCLCIFYAIAFSFFPFFLCFFKNYIQSETLTQVIKVTQCTQVNI